MEVESSTFKKQDGAPAETINVTGPGEGGKSDEAELYQHPGVISRPEDGEICAVIEVGEQKIIIGTLNYKVSKSIDKGERFIYSVVDGVVKSSIYLKKDGELIFNEGTKDAARKDDTTQLNMSGVDVQALAAALLTTGAFVPTGSLPVPATVPLTFTDGKITQGTDKVKLP